MGRRTTGRGDVVVPVPELVPHSPQFPPRSCQRSPRPLAGRVFLEVRWLVVATMMMRDARWRDCGMLCDCGAQRPGCLRSKSGARNRSLDLREITTAVRDPMTGMSQLARNCNRDLYSPVRIIGC